MMGLQKWFRGKPQSLVGIDIGSSSVKVAALKPHGKGFKIEALGQQELPEDSIVDGAILAKLPVADAIDSIYADQKIRNNSIATSISGHSVIVKRVTLPDIPDKELDQSIRWEAEQYIPFDINDVNVDYQVIQRSPEAMKLEVLLVAAKKEKIRDYTAAVSLAGKKASVVDVDAFALQNIYELSYQPERRTVAALLDLGAHVVNVNIVRGVDFLFIRDIALGGSQYNEFLQKELGLDFETAEKYKRGIDVPSELAARVASIRDGVSENLALEIEKTFDFFRTTTSAPDISEVYVCGGACRTEGLLPQLESALGLPVQVLDPFRVIDADPHRGRGVQENAADYAVALGLALRKAFDR